MKRRMAAGIAMILVLVPVHAAADLPPLIPREVS